MNKILITLILTSATIGSSAHAGPWTCEDVLLGKTNGQLVTDGQSLTALALTSPTSLAVPRTLVPLSTTGHRFVEDHLQVLNRISLVERSAIFEHLILNPHLLFGHIGEMAVQTYLFSVASGPMKQTYVLSSLQKIKKVIRSTAVHKLPFSEREELDQYKREAGERLLLVLTDLSRRQDYQHGTLNDFNGNKISLDGHRVTSGVKLALSSSAQTYVKFWEWVYAAPDRVEYAKLLLAEASVPLSQLALRTADGPRGDYLNEVNFTDAEARAQLARFSTFGTKLKKFFWRWGSDNHADRTILNSKKMLATKLGLFGSVPQIAGGSAQKALPKAKPVDVPQLPSTSYQPGADDLRGQIALLQIDSDYGFALSDDASSLISGGEKVTRASLILFPAIKTQLERLEQIAQNTEAMNQRLALVAGAGDLRSLKITTEVKLVEERRRLVEKLQADLQDLLGQAQMLLVHYHNLISRSDRHQMKVIQTENSLLRTKFNSLHRVTQSSADEIRVHLAKMKREIAEMEITLATGSAPRPDTTADTAAEAEELKAVEATLSIDLDAAASD